MLQSSPVLARLKSAVTKRVITELTKKAEKEPEAFAKFWENFGAVVKEGLYEDADNREKILATLAEMQSLTDAARASHSSRVQPNTPRSTSTVRRPFRKTCRNAAGR
jgi:molecular chaperone HtpG